VFEEVDALVKNGVDVEGRLYLSDRAHLVMPYHKLVDKESAASKAIGTTGRGIGPAYEDKVARRGIRVLDLRHPARLKALVEKGTDHANHILAASGRPSARTRRSRWRRAEPDRAAPAGDRRGRGARVHRAQKQGAAILLEGAQGSLLDIDHGTYPFVTSSSTTAGGAAIGRGDRPRARSTPPSAW
jgi:adenylosuccinate synthase